MASKFYTTIFILCTVFSGVPIISGEEEEDKLTVSPEQIAEQLGQSATFTCSHSNAENMEPIMWLSANGTKITGLNATRLKDSDGVLEISDIQSGDAGEYICTTTNRTMNATATLKIYDMPSYFVEGMVLMGINIVLVLIFIGCAIYQFVKSWRSKKMRGNKSFSRDIYMDKASM